MDKILAFIIDVIIAVMILLLAVQIYFGLRTESVIQTLDEEIEEDFLTDTKEQGVLTVDGYEKFLYKLSLTGSVYEVLFQHIHPVYEPEYRMRTLEEIIAAQKAAYTGENIYHYREVVTYPDAVTDPIDNSGLTMNTETNESILAGAVSTPADAGHVHTDECYKGHRHTPIFGSLDLSNVQVYFKIGVDYFSNHYYRYIDILCAECKEPIYTIRYNNSGSSSPYYGYTLEHDYDSEGNVSTVRKDFNFAASTSQWKYVQSFISKLTQWIDSNSRKTGNSRTSYRTNWKFGTMPVWDSSGNRIDLPFTGCKNKKGHPNKACYPVGDVAKPVNVTFYRRYSDNQTYYSINVTCAECGKEIMNISGQNYFGGSAGGYGYGSRVNVSKYAFDDQGNIVQERHSYGTSYVNGLVYNVFQPVFEYCYSLPNKTVTVDNSFLYEATATDVKWEYDDIYYLQGSEIDPPASDIDPDGFYEGTMKYSGCPYCSTFGEHYSCGLSETLVCDQKVASITPTNPEQSVYTGEDLITTVTATYQNGSTKVVEAAADFTTDTPVMGKEVILSYTDTLGNTCTCIITVNVIPRTKTCVNGHTYNLNPDGSDPGCPYCRAYVSNIRILSPITSTLTITIGTTLQDNGVTLLITYQDGHTKTIKDGYEDNLDSQYLGTKLVTIGYKGAATQLMVTTVCAKMTCDVCGFVYDLYPDGTNPGCPRCIARIPVFTGNVLQYDNIEYTADILEQLYQDGKYVFDTGDTFEVDLRNKSSTVARKLLQKIIPGLSDRWLSLRKSETVRLR